VPCYIGRMFVGAVTSGLLLHVRHGYSSQSLLTRDELVHAISQHSVNWLAVRCTLCLIFKNK